MGHEAPVALWWVVLVAGVLVFSSTARSVTRAYGDRRIPRLGFFAGRGHRLPWSAKLSIVTGMALLSVGSGELAGPPSDGWRYLGYFITAVVVSLVAQMAMVWAHNRRVSSPDGAENMETADHG